MILRQKSRAIDTDDGIAGQALADADDTTVTSDASQSAGAKRSLLQQIKRLRPRLGAVLLTLVLAATGLVGGLYYFQYRPDRDTDTSVAQTAIRAATDGTVALLSYSPETLDRDFATAKSRLTGDFLDYYNTFTTQVVAPAVAQKAVKTNAAVVRAAVTELRSGAAVVLVFVNQSTTSSDKPDPSMSSSSVLVTLTKVDDAWLISSFDPVV
jgi:Mce-associated membrane protein